MAKRRQAESVTLTAAQRERLERLWFYYGNYGPATTPGNHQFIQGLLEHGLDVRPSFTSRTRKSERPTDECERAVDAVLKESDKAKDSAPGGGPALRLVESREAGMLPAPDTELKEILDDLRRRYRVQRERLECGPEPPEAA